MISPLRPPLSVRLVARPPVVGRLVGFACGDRPLDTRGWPEALAQAARQLTARSGWRGEEGQRRETRVGEAGAVLELVGLGAGAALSGSKLRQALARAVERGAADGARALTLVLPVHPETAGEIAAERIAREVALADYRFDRHRAPADERKARPAIGLVAPTGEAEAYRRGLRVGQAVARGVALARDLANAPPNEATPEWMARQAAACGRALGARVRVLGPRDLARRRMGGILAVGGGSRRPPRLVRLDWGQGRRVVALVGKGVTFDTGGISIKPAADMDEMKYDKAGACTALGVLVAAAALRLPLRLRLYLPFAENMPDGAAYRPGDIVRCRNGKTVEILNTDAEGRLLLADALAWACEEKPDRLLDFATLTGACVVALGQSGAGLFSADEELAAGLLAAAEATGERLWRLPLWPEFAEQMKGNHGDLRNSGGRWGGASTAAAFLAQFVTPAVPWAHLDIAGPAYGTSGGNGKKSATGFGVPLALRWLSQLAAGRHR